VRRLSLSLALQEALAEEYGCTPVYGIPLVYTPPPEKLHTSTYYLVLKNAKIGDNSTDQNNNAEINDNWGRILQRQGYKQSYPLLFLWFDAL